MENVKLGRRVLQLWHGELRDVGSEEGFMGWYWYPEVEEQMATKEHYILADVVLDMSNI